MYNGNNPHTHTGVHKCYRGYKMTLHNYAGDHFVDSFHDEHMACVNTMAQLSNSAITQPCSRSTRQDQSYPVGSLQLFGLDDSVHTCLNET